MGYHEDYKASYQLGWVIIKVKNTKNIVSENWRHKILSGLQWWWHQWNNFVNIMTSKRNVLAIVAIDDIIRKIFQLSGRQWHQYNVLCRTAIMTIKCKSSLTSVKCDGLEVRMYVYAHDLERFETCCRVVAKVHSFRFWDFHTDGGLVLVYYLS